METLNIDEHSEDGQLKSPENDRNYSTDEGDTGDSLDIKPPQAKTADYKYKEKKSKDKKHSRSEHKRRDKDRERHKERLGSEHQRHRFKNKHQDYNRKPEYDDSKHYYTEKDLYYKQHRMEKKSRESSRKSSPQSIRNKELEVDLRNRLLYKKQKYEADIKQSKNSNLDDYYDQKETRESRKMEKEYYEMRKDKKDYYIREKREREMVEVIDSPEYHQEIHMNTKVTTTIKHPKEYDEKELRKKKLLDADREKTRNKERAREELEARREQRRERGTASRNESLSPEPPKKKKYVVTEEEEKRESDDVVMVSDHSDELQGEEEDEEDDSESDSSTNSERSKSEEKDVPSPLSVGHLSKSERRSRSRKYSRSRSRSKSVSRSPSKSKSRSPHSRSSRSSRSSHRSSASSRSRSRGSSEEYRSKSKSKSRSKSPSRSKSRSRSRSGTKSRGSSTEKKEETKSKSEPEPSSSKEVEEVVDELPSYFPAIQGCRSVEEFQCLNRIEEGTYGVVYRAKDKRTEEIVALKRLKMEKEKEGFPITSLREINTLLKGQHPNIVTVREIVVGSNMDKIFIVMDYVEHDLKSLMETMKHKKQVFLPGEVKCLAQQLLRAVAHLHDNWILHRDLKTSNLLLSHKGILKVGDFGLAREYGSPLKPYTSIVVTLWYRAPELLLGCKEYSTPIDVWSCGCIFAELLSMTALFPGKSEVDQLNRIFKDLGTPNERIWPGYDELPLVKKMTFSDYPVSQIRKKFSHLTSELGLSLLQGLLTYDPKQRLTADAALKSNYFKELPLPIDPAMFPTWPAKSELGLKKALASSPKPPSGGGEFKKLGADDGSDNTGFTLAGAGYASYSESRQLAMGPGFSLKF